MSLIDQPHADYLREHERGLLATVAPNATPQNKPVGYRYDEEHGTIDIAGTGMESSAKFRNVALRPDVAFTVEDQPDAAAGAGGVRFLEVRGIAERVRLDAPMIDGTDLTILRIHPRRLVSWNVAGEGAFSADLDDALRRERPRLAVNDAVDARARAAAEALVAELQAGIDSGDADVYNRHFADDLLWGSPYGATLTGYDTLHPIHERLLGAGEHPSRYEIEQLLAPTPDVVLAHVRRRASSGEDFSEMALYVLVRRDGEWWLAAGQNTVVDPTRGALRQEAA